ncbi:PAS domain S-box protein [Desertibaculum subflavum]|uniref:PAS domain S-box protein n=1 Tax=Desertibaculum subflavum TaxID=2268458 RepID=UPI000E667EB6
MRAEVANRRAAPLIGAAVAGLGILVLGAWAFNVPILQSLNPQWVTMKANTALSFVLAGSALWLLGEVDRSARQRLAGTLAAMAMGMVGLLTVLAYALGLDLGLDQWLFSDPSTPIPMHPGRPAPATALLFVLVAVSLFLLRAARPALVILADTSIGLVAASGYLAIIGYFYGAPGLYTVPGYSSMALHTAVGFVLLGVGLFLARTDRGIMRLVTARRAAGATARRLLPVAMLAPVLLGYAELYAFEHLGLSTAAADLLLIVAVIAIFAGTILWSVAAVDRVDAQRQRLELAGRLADQQAKDELRWRNLLESAPDASVVADAEGRIRFVNARTEDLFGYAREEMVGRPVEMLLPEGLRAAHVGHRAIYQRAPLSRPMQTSGALYGRRKNGDEFPVEVSLAPVGTDEGELIAAAIRDSTVRLQRETQILEARAAAEAATRRLQALIEAVPLAVVEIDRDRLVRSWNPAAERIFGWRAEELLGRELSTIPADRKGEIDFLMVATTDSRPLQAFETRRIRKDGTTIDVSIWTAPRFDPDGSNAGMISIVADITEQKRLEEHFRQSQRLQAVGQLTGGIAHEFNNILQVLLGNLDFLRDPVRGDPNATRTIDALMRAVRRGADLTHQLLAFSRKQPLRPRALNPEEELRSMEKLVRASIGAQYSVQIEIAADVSTVLADNTQLDNAILNLVINARDAMPTGGSLRLRAENAVVDEARAQNLDIPPGHYVAIEVIDSGTGMTPEVLARAVEPFFTTKEVGKGTGLGLSMVHGFVRQSGGALEIVSEPGHGTTVRLLLPATTEAAHEEVTLRPRLIGPRNITVLVVEDEPEVLRTAAVTLRGLGYTVIEAADGPSALAALRQAGHVDVLFTDVVLPKGMSGRDLAEVVRAHQPHVAIIYTSGYNENVIAHDNVLDKGIVLVRKPYSKEDLLAAISGVTKAKVSAVGRWSRA